MLHVQTLVSSHSPAPPSRLYTCLGLQRDWVSYQPQVCENAIDVERMGQGLRAWIADGVDCRQYGTGLLLLYCTHSPLST